MSKLMVMLALAALLGGCASHTGRTSPCVCDWRPVDERGSAAV